MTVPEYQLLSCIRRKAQKTHRCVWCPEDILPGTEYDHEKSVQQGEVQEDRWHPECRAAALEFFRTEHNREFVPHEFKRGTEESA